jgi:hypothetical protein
MLVSVPSWGFDTDGLQVTAPPPETSPENVQLAAQHFDTAVDLYRHGKYDLARIEFEASYALSRSADLLHNLSQTAEKQHKFDEAIRYEEQFLEAKRAELTQGEIDQTQGRLFRLREQAAGRVVPPEPISAPTEQPSAPTERRKMPAGAIGLLALGGAGVVVGIGCGAGAYETAQAFNQPLTVTDANTLTSRGQALDRAGIAFDVLGGMSLAAGLIWAVVDRVRQPSRQAALARLAALTTH